MANRIKTQSEISAMRRGGKMLATVLDYLRQETAVGLTPKHMSDLAAQKLKQLGGEPAFRGFQGYPDIICISVNDQVQHSIPTDTPFRTGDVINYDFGVLYGGMVTDGGITVGVEPLSSDAKRLITGTEEALSRALMVVKDGCRVGDVSAVIEDTLRKYKLGIVRELVGHGVGHELHEDPEIPNYGSRGTGPVLRAGMTIAIEPISTLGRHEISGDRNGWTLWTVDGSLSAQFEHTLLVTETGCEILTQL